jgi:hypothetical protein
MKRPSNSWRSLAGHLARPEKKGMGYANRTAERMIRYDRETIEARAHRVDA